MIKKYILILLTIFFFTNQGFGQKKNYDLKNDYDIYNFVIDKMLGEKKCGWGYSIGRFWKRRCIGATFIVNNQNDSTYYFYYKILENRHKYKYFVDSLEQPIILYLVDSIYSNRTLANLNIDSLKNDRKCCTLVMTEEELISDSKIYLSKIEKDKTQKYAAIYVNLDVGPLAGLGNIFFFKKEIDKWTFLTMIRIWIS